jgi:SAM-dependent methyltransferase
MTDNPYIPVPIPQGEEEVRQRHASNRLAWNQGAERYAQELNETLDFLRTGHSSLHPIERQNLGELRDWCHTAIHLQCASGRDTLSLLHEGVRQVVGVDISDVHIANARWLTEQLGAPAAWYRCDVLDTPHALDGTADLVYTGRGALCWLQDLQAWAVVVYRLLKPGGIFHVLDDHPVTWLFDMDAETLVPSGLNYFSHSEYSQGWPETYIGELSVPVGQQAVKYERAWPLSTIFQCLREAGLVVDTLGEHPDPYWDICPNLKPELRATLPLTFSLKAHRPR